MSTPAEEEAEEIHKKYITCQLFNEIRTIFGNEEPVDLNVERVYSLDGFMSSIYNVSLITQVNGKTRKRVMLLKLMRGAQKFRERSNSSIQCANEIYFYAKILPAYSALLEELDLTANCLKADFGYIEGLSLCPEEQVSVLLLENLTPLGYKMCPRLELSLPEIHLMLKPLAQLHALGYALRFLEPAKFEELKAGIEPLPFHYENPELQKNNVFRVLHEVSFERFFAYYERKIVRTYPASSHIRQSLDKLRHKYGKSPTKLLEHFRVSVLEQEEHKYFATILHGDFNRNNVLFHYGEEDKVADAAKLIDFQELRYGSPALDLSFFMHMNILPDKQSDWFPGILDFYHKEMLATLHKLLLAKGQSEQQVDAYMAHFAYDKFQEHFSKFAFYGVIICMHYLPWLLSSIAERTELTKWFEKDMHSQKFRRLSLKVGGDPLNDYIFQIVQFADDNHYMEHLI